MQENTIQLPFTTSHAFIVGINDYVHLSPLSTAVRDAEVLSEALAKEHRYQVHPPLLNADKAALDKLFQEVLPNSVGPEDRVLIYFAGHGIALDSDDDPKGYLVPADAQPGDDTTLLAMDVVHEAINKLPCRHGMLILDCCFAGAFKWSTGFRDVVFDLPGVIYEERFYQYAQDPAWQVITSSASDQKAVDILSNRTLGMRSESSTEHSPFAAALLAGLAGEADTVPKDKGDGVITATELYTYLRDRVEDETSEQGKRQSPSMFSLSKHDKGQYIFLHPRHPQNLPPIPDRNPFMGLKSYNETDSNLFYGRDRVIAALKERLQQQSLVIVSGASGTGKSSVIKAGVLPQLRKQKWQILPVLRPGKEPLVSLRESLPQGLPAIDEPSLLIVDQYEELITQCLHPEDRITFEEQLDEWLRAHPQLRIIISIRSDFEPQFEGGTLASWWEKGRYVVPAFNQDELREVIIKPTVQEVLFFEPDSLVDKLVDAVNQAPGALPLLSFTLSELYHTYVNSGRTNRAFTLEDYEKLGGVIGALRTRANKIYDELDRPHQDSMRKLMLRMVSLEGGELASRRVASNDLIFSDDAETQRLENVAQQLVAARLISTGRDAQGNTYYEPAHDALVRAWARLWEWIKAQGEGKMGLMYKLSLAVGDYQQNPTSEYLWNDDPRLDVLLADLASTSHNFNAQEEDFLEKSKALRQRNQRRRWAIIAAVMVGLLGLTVFALFEQGQAKQSAREAENARQEAVDSARVAQEQRQLATLKANEARDSAAVAQQERANATEQTKLALSARDEARRAQARAEQRTRETKSVAAVVRARGVLDQDPTVALNLALAAYELEPTPEAIALRRELLSDPDIEYYHKAIECSGPIIGLAADGQSVLVRIIGRNFVGRNFVMLQNLLGEEIGTFPVGPRVGSWYLSSGDEHLITLSPAGKRVITSDFRGEVTISAASGEEIATLSGTQVQTEKGVAFSPNGNRIATIDNGERLNFWNLNGEQQLSLDLPGSSANLVAFAPAGQGVFTAHDDHTVRHLNLQGEVIAELSGHKAEITDIAYVPSGNMIATASRDSTAKVWSTSGELLATLVGHQNMINSVCFAPDGQWVATGSSDGTARVWDLQGQLRKTFPHPGTSVNTVRFLPDAVTLLTGAEDRQLRFWNLNNRLLQTFNGHKAAVRDATFAPDGKTIVTASADRTARFWQMSGQQQSMMLTGERALNQAKYTPDGKTIVTVDKRQQVTLWDQFGNQISSFADHENYSNIRSAIALTPNGKFILTGLNADHTAKLWNLKGEVHRVFSGSTAQTVTNSLGISEIGLPNYVQCVAVSPNGKRIATSNMNQTARLWSIDGRELAILYEIDGNFRSLGEATSNDRSITSMTFSPTGQILAAADRLGTIKLWNERGREIISFDSKPRATNLAFSPDAKTLAAVNSYSSDDAPIKLWNLRGEEILSLSGHQSRVNSVAFSTDGLTILTSSDDGTAKLWRNLHAEYNTGTLWSHVYKLTPEQRAEYKIDWKY